MSRAFISILQSVIYVVNKFRIKEASCIHIKKEGCYCIRLWVGEMEECGQLDGSNVLFLMPLMEQMNAIFGSRCQRVSFSSAVPDIDVCVPWESSYAWKSTISNHTRATRSLVPSTSSQVSLVPMDQVNNNSLMGASLSFVPLTPNVA